MLFRSYKALWEAVKDFEIRAGNVEALCRRFELSLMKVGSEQVEETDQRPTLEFERQELRARMSRRGSSADATISSNSQMVDNSSPTDSTSNSRIEDIFQSFARIESAMTRPRPTAESSERAFKAIADELPEQNNDENSTEGSQDPILEKTQTASTCKHKVSGQSGPRKLFQEQMKFKKLPKKLWMKKSPTKQASYVNTYFSHRTALSASIRDQAKSKVGGRVSPKVNWMRMQYIKYYFLNYSLKDVECDAQGGLLVRLDSPPQIIPAPVPALTPIHGFEGFFNSQPEETIKLVRKEVHDNIPKLLELAELETETVRPYDETTRFVEDKWTHTRGDCYASVVNDDEKDYWFGPNPIWSAGRPVLSISSLFYLFFIRISFR